MQYIDSSVDEAIIQQVREASRQLVREFGFMKPHLAATHLPPSALHTLLEIDIRGPKTAAELCDCLHLEKSSVSRMVKKLQEMGELSTSVVKEDARSKRLHLTDKGRETVAVAHEYASHQVGSALGLLSKTTQASVASGLNLYSSALAADRRGEGLPNDLAKPYEAYMVRGYRPGAIGRIATLFSSYFSQHYDFGQYFESKVATELSEFSHRIDHADNELWLVVQQEGDQLSVLGGIAIDGEQDTVVSDIGDKAMSGGKHAHLRWFILDPCLSGQGFGRQLIEQAIAFCVERQYQTMYLWTVKGLDAAGTLYDDYSFVIEEEKKDRQWGKEAVEQRRVKYL